MFLTARAHHDIQNSMRFGAFKQALLCTTILAGLTMMPAGAWAADPATVTELGTLGASYPEPLP
ncbi:MAG TPA: hypothetical protein DCY07_05800 [Rhodospirillaceae bacterium]|nr:hypothetical protein [Rhodospirillaceae bacterium]